MRTRSTDLHSASLQMDMCGCIFLGLNQPGYEANNSPPYNDVIKNWWSCTSTPKTLWRIQGQLPHSKKKIGFSHSI